MAMASVRDIGDVRVFFSHASDDCYVGAVSSPSLDRTKFAYFEPVLVSYKECRKHPMSTRDKWARNIAAKTKIYDIREFVGGVKSIATGYLDQYIEAVNEGGYYYPNIKVQKVEYYYDYSPIYHFDIATCN